MSKQQSSSEQSSLPRYDQSRRAFLRRSAVAGLVIAAPSALVACGDNDADVFGGASSTSASAAPPSTAVASSPAPQDTSPATTEATAADAAATSDPIAVTFTYTMAAGGKQLNPYVAVWVEDTNGVMLRTLGLYYHQSSKGTRWLDDLRTWWRADQDRIASGGNDIAQVISSATRSPGEYSLLWDGLDDNGEPVTADDVVICIESARERGSYSLICEPITRSAVSSAVALPDNEELSGATVTVA